MREPAGKSGGSSRCVWTVLCVVLLVPPLASSQSLDDLARRAEALKPSPPRYVQNVKIGMRGVTFAHMAVAPTDPNTIYATSYDGFIFGSSDGGKSWTEGRLITLRAKFFGAIRPGSKAGIGLARSTGVLNLRGNLDFGLQYDEATSYTNTIKGDSTSIKSDAVGGLTGLTDTTRGTIADSAGGGGGGGDSARFGVGITRAAPRLQALLKKKRARLVGANLKLLLNLRGVEATWVNHVAVSPLDSKHVLAATAQGLFISRDGGLGWDHVFAGRNARERWCNFVAFDATDPGRIFLGTWQGLMTSTDGGEKFSSITGSQLSDADTRWIEFSSAKPGTVYAGTNIGVFRSNDNGSTWKWIFFETLPAANVIKGIAIDPESAERVTIATGDGLFRTVNGGLSWEVVGGFLFQSLSVNRIISDPSDSNHLVCCTSRFVWETFDAGTTWSALYINDSDWSPRALMYDPHNKGVFWILTSAEMLRLSSTPPKPARPELLAALRERLKKEPSLSQAMDAAFRTADVHRGERGNTRNNARLSGMLPTINLLAGYTSGTSAADVGDYVLQIPGSSTEVAINGGEFSRSTGAPYPKGWNGEQTYVMLSLNWSLPDLAFHIEEAPYGRYFDTSNYYYREIKSEVQRLYEERRRVLIELATIAPDDVRSRMFLRLRLEELTAHLDSLTSGLYASSLALLEVDGWLPPEGTQMSPKVIPTGQIPPPAPSQATQPAPKTNKTRVINY
ncbi:MAG: photosystem II stability/assembly factor-like uncharacterized protein [Myxococcota bacterium]